jgi:hypothetical protein
MTSPMRPLAALACAAILAACGGDPSSPTLPTSVPPSPGAESPAATSPTPGATGTSTPSSAASTDGGAAFTCDLPVVEAGSAPIANIVDVRAATHDGYDRLVFEFAQGTPDVTVERAEPPFTEDASGLPVEVDGERFLALVMRGGTKQTDAGTSSYEGPTELATGFPGLVHAVEAGDFERQSTWILGLADEACVRVIALDDPARLVIDVEH